MPLLNVTNLNKSFFSVRVVRDVSFSLRAGRILGLVGENGSGKSTTMNMLGGILRPDSGTMHLDGADYAPANPREAQRAGVALIQQDPNLFENLSIEENLFLNRLPRRRWSPLIDRSAIREQTRQLLDTMNLQRPPTALVGGLSAGERQLIEVAKALATHARIFLFDEPTSSLTAREAQRLFTIIERLKGQGLGVIYISHVLDDVIRLCDEVMVLRDGVAVARGATDELPPSEMVKAMVGRTIDQLFPPRAGCKTEQPLLEVRGLSQPAIVRDIDLTLHAGEILGVAGLMGSGRTELVRILYGLDPYKEGTIRLGSKRLRRPAPRRCMAGGMAMLTEDRHNEGLMMEAPILDNMSLSALDAYATNFPHLIRRDSLVRAVAQMSRSVGLSHSDRLWTLAKHLSGGNQQKVVLGKWLLRFPKVFIMDEPTRGIDVGARHEIYKIINQLADNGAGVLMISSEIEELMGLCDRIHVMSHGEIRATYSREAFDSNRILEAAIRSGVKGIDT